MKDTVVSGSLRATDTLYSTTAQFNILKAPTSSGGTTYGPGTNGYILTSNGTSAFWAANFTGLAARATADADNNTISTTYLKKSGGTMAGLITAWSGVAHSGIKIGNTYLTAIDGDIIFQNNSAIRFGTDDWNWDKWAGLKFDATNKIIYLGIADQSIFTGNDALSNGTLSLINTRYFKMYGKDVFNINTAIDNTAFTSVLSLFHNETNESTVSNFDATKSSWGITFERQWSSGDICTKAAGIFAYGINNWRTGLVFRTKTGTTNTGAHDTTALYLNHDGSATFANTVNATTFVGALTGNAATATKLSTNASNTTASFWRGDNTWSNSLANYIFNTTDMPGGEANFNTAATANTITFHRNGIIIPNPETVNDGGFIRVQGTGESDTILELGTWDDSGAGETIQFNYYPVTSRVTPAYSVSVPKATGTICLTDGTGASGTWGISITGNANSATYDSQGNNIQLTYVKNYTQYTQTINSPAFYLGDNTKYQIALMVPRGTTTDDYIAILALYNGAGASVMEWYANSGVKLYGTLQNGSSLEIKKDINLISLPENIIDKLTPISFKYKEHTDNKTHFGLIYEDTINLIPEICSENKNGYKTINYVELVPILLKEIQNLRTRVKTLEQK